VEDLCEKVSWPLHNLYPNAHDALTLHINGEIDVWKELDFSKPGNDLSSMEEKLKSDITEVLKRRLTASLVRLQAKCEVSCSEYEGIDAVKDALQEGFKASKDDLEVNIKLIAHPVFALSCMCRDKQEGIKSLDEAMQHFETAIHDRGGSFTLKSKPTFVQKEEKDEDKEGSSDGEGSESGSSDGDQDDTMGNFNADFTDLMKKDVDKDDEE